MTTHDDLEDLLTRAGRDLQHRVATVARPRDTAVPARRAARRRRQKRWTLAAAAATAVATGILVVGGLSGAPETLRIGPDPARPPAVSPPAASSPSAAEPEATGTPGEATGPVKTDLELLPGWEQVTQLEHPRSSAHVFSTPDGLIVFGGNSDPFVGRREAGFRENWGGVLVDVQGGESHELPPSPLCANGEAHAAWTGEELVVWETPTSDTCLPAAAFSPSTWSWRDLDVAAFRDLGRSPVVWSGREIIAWQKGIAIDPASGNTRTMTEAPDSAAISGETVHSPPTAHWTGDGIVVLGSAELVRYDATADTWETLSAPPIGGRARASVWTGSELLAVNYEMEAATWAPDRGWHSEAPMPLRFYECLADPTADDGYTIVRMCSGIAQWASEGWRLLPLPHPRLWGASTVTAAGQLVVVADGNVLRTQLSDPAQPVADAHARTFPVNTHMITLPDGWAVTSTGSTHDSFRSDVTVRLTDKAGRTCEIVGIHTSPVAELATPDELERTYDGETVDVTRDTTDDGHTRIRINDGNGSDITDVICPDHDAARALAAALWWPWEQP